MKFFYLIILSLFFPLSATAQYGHWEEIVTDTNPGYLSAHAMASVGKNKVLLFGGHISLVPGGQYSNKTWLFDLETRQWTEIHCKTSPKSRRNHAMTRISENKVLLYGGRGGKILSDSAFSDMWEFDLDSMNWYEVHPDTVIDARYSHTMAAFNEEEIVIFGGQKPPPDILPTWEAWIFNVKEKAFKGKSSHPNLNRRYNHMMSEVQKNVILTFGGEGPTILDDYWLYKKIDTTFFWKWYWYELGNFQDKPPLCRASFAAKIRDGLILYLSDSCSYVTGSRTWIFDYNNNTWHETKLDVQPYRTHSHRMAQIAEDKVLLYGGIGMTLPFNTWLFVLDSLTSVDDNLMKKNNKKVGIRVNNHTIDIYFNQFMQNGVVEIYNLQGILVYRSDLPRSMNISIPADNFATGLYMVIIKMDNEIYREKVILLKY